MSALDELAARIVQDEGGVADVGDGKGITRYGQTPDWLEQFGLPVPQSPAQAEQNYVIWMVKTGLSKLVGATVDDLTDILLDIAVMSDHRKAIKALQQVLGVQVDGTLGEQTLLALSRVARDVLARKIIAWDMRYQGRLIQQDPTRARYAAGWADRMAKHVERLS